MIRYRTAKISGALVLLFLVVASTAEGQTRTAGRIGAMAGDHRIEVKTATSRDRVVADQLATALHGKYPIVTSERLLQLRARGKSFVEALHSLGVPDPEAVSAVPQQPTTMMLATKPVTVVLPDTAGDVEFTYSFVTGIRSAPADSLKQVLPGGLWCAFSKWLSIEFDDDTVSSIDTPGILSAVGPGDATLSLNTALMQEYSDWRPKLLATYVVTIPFASSVEGLGSGFVDHQILGELQKHWGPSYNSSVVFDFGETWTGNGQGYSPGTNLAVKYKVKSERPVVAGAKLGLDTEFDWSGPSGENGAEVAVIAGPRFVLSSAFAIRAGAKFTHSEGTTKNGIYVGIVADGNISNLARRPGRQRR
jgi:hypothetical protein